jgi:hypothetical protein
LDCRPHDKWFWQDLLLPAAGMDPPHRLDQLDAVANGDVGDGAALDKP